MHAFTIILLIWLAPAVLLLIAAAMWIMMRAPLSPPADAQTAQPESKEVSHEGGDRDAV